ncbi:MAG: hypothetical protein A2285_03830 [Elusimicrobia bacterium RIFOXYA12_FULL_57_11]|nr:MAG: hypothetical protein A2285_03830 [Elusimicrobia bacterium RIFOXYA12_FULL_57_11]
MSRKNYLTLNKAAETITTEELAMAPELATLAALDATLLASTDLLEFQYPHLRNPASDHYNKPCGVDEHLVESICALANVLRKNLSAYYATIQESCEGDQTDNQIMF